MASYNWGEQRVIRMLKTMPANPRERNFWKVLEQHRDQVPPETYNYVMRIVSAAVIGENPKLFGFAFDSPLGRRPTRSGRVLQCYGSDPTPTSATFAVFSEAVKRRANVRY